MSIQEIPLLDGGYIRFVEDWGYGDAQVAEAGIIEAARMSTQGAFKGWGPQVTGIACYPNGEVPPDRRRMVLPGFLEEVWRKHGKPDVIDATNPFIEVREEPGDERLLAYLHERAHSTPFEFAGMVVEVQAPIMVFREWHRHRTQSYNEMSARYAPLPANDYMPTPKRCLMVSAKNKQAGAATGSDVLTHEKVIEWLGQLREAYDVSDRVYRNGLQWGIPKELARLPVGVGRMSRMRAHACLRNWLAFMTLRSERNPNAQWEIRQFGNALAQLCRQRFPQTMLLFDGVTT